MTVRSDGDIIHLEGVCGVEEAETLAILFDENRPWEVDLSGCRHLHGAVIQALLTFRPKVRGEAAQDVFLKEFIHPALALALDER
jgi:hypothetical protein